MRTFVALLISFAAFAPLHADNISFTHGRWRVTYVENTHAFRLQATRSGGDSYNPVVTNSIPEASYTDGEGVSHSLSVADMTAVNYEATAIDDGQFGQGLCHTFTFSKEDCPVKMVQRYYAYDGKDYLLADMQLTAQEEIRSNYIAPICSKVSYRLLTASSNNRMLKVPFDNDGYQRYQRYQLSTSMTSYEVTAIYSGDDRHGLVIGSVDHDHWKSAIDVTGQSNSNISAIKVYSGVSTTETRDNIPHGMLRGTSISSARFYLDFTEDWRDGMDNFAKANTLVVPKNDSCKNGTPIGWQGWGVLAEKSNNTDVTEIAQYYNDVLQPGGFHNAQGNVILSLDASDGLSDSQRKALCSNGSARHQLVGNYSTPFSLWWGEDEIDNYVGTINGVDYTVRDICLKVNGEPVRYDGAWAVDPTHPKVKQDIVNFVNNAAAMGIKYIKCDFVNCGIIQADSYYKESIHTAVEAYSEGMRYLANRAAAKGIFLALGMAPLFPYQYANARRVTCDTWGKIDQTEYAMNALSSGWWTAGLYQYNDPDHVVLVGNGTQAETTIGENRARFTNAAITGMVLVADNFSTSNVSQRGVPSLSKSRAKEVLLNADMNAIAQMGVSFRPLYGCKEYQGAKDKAEHFHVYRTDDYLYVAGINYGSTDMSGSISWDDLGLQQSAVGEIKELWTGESEQPGESLQYKIPNKDARVYRITFIPSAIDKVSADEVSDDDTHTTWYNASGCKVSGKASGLCVSDKGEKRIFAR